MEANEFFANFKEKLIERFSLNHDSATQEEVTVNVRKGIYMRGTNLWVLIFAIFIASLGLNINSTAVIIGAMLISPLMGPIIGVGFSFGINDFSLLKVSFRNFLVMVVTSLIASTLFFLLPLISYDKSELLARTVPTTYDLLIALFGGLSGMVAQTRKDRTGTVISGVAIATALMPPLCTAGYGLATLQLRYFLGASYLFLMNSVFIALASYFVSLMLKYEKVAMMDKVKEEKLRRWMYLLILIVTAPSVLIAVNIFQRSNFTSNAGNFIKTAMMFERTVVVDQNIQFNGRRSTSVIEVRLIGETLSENIVENLRSQMKATPYHLKNTELIVRQTGQDEKLDISALQMSYADILKEKNREIETLQMRLTSIKVIDTVAVADISRELGVFVPEIRDISLSKHIGYNKEGVPVDTSFICMLGFNDILAESKVSIIENWLRTRLRSENVQIIVKLPVEL